MEKPDLPSVHRLHTGRQVLIEPLPATVDAAIGFLAIQRAAYLATYVGLPCINQLGQADRIQPSDMDGLYDYRVPGVITGLVTLAARGFNPTADSSTLLLRARAPAEGAAANATIGTLNLKFGTAAYAPNELLPEKPPAKAKLHEINVHPSSLRQGIGRLLLSSALATIRPYCDEKATLRLITQCGNNAARTWYDQHGIQTTGRTTHALWGDRKVRIQLEERAAQMSDIPA